MDFNTENTNQTNRLRALSDRISRDWTKELGGGWTVGSMLYHVAFWDKVRYVYIKRWMQSGQLSPNLDMENTHSINESVRALSETLSADDGLRFSLKCAE